MEHRQLGCTGVSVSKFCLGAMMFGAWGNPDHDESIGIIHAALDAGINFIDTADLYGQGESEEIVGKALADGRRDTVILATKFHNAMGDDPNQQGNSRRWILRAVEDSLRRLGTDWIDLRSPVAGSQAAGERAPECSPPPALAASPTASISRIRPTSASSTPSSDWRSSPTRRESHSFSSRSASCSTIPLSPQRSSGPAP